MYEEVNIVLIILMMLVGGYAEEASVWADAFFLKVKKGTTAFSETVKNLFEKKKTKYGKPPTFKCGEELLVFALTFLLMVACQKYRLALPIQGNILIIEKLTFDTISLFNIKKSYYVSS